MARKPQVTRTIQTTNATVLCLNINEGEPFSQIVTLPRTYKNDDAILKAARPLIENDDVKAVHIVDVKVVETLYGMDESDFIKYATPLPPRTSAKTDVSIN